MQAGLDSVTLQVGAVLALAAIFMVFGVRFSLDRSAQKRRKRVSRLNARWVQGEPPVPTRSDAASGILRRESKDSSFQSFDRLIKRLLPNPELLRERLIRTGKDITLGVYVLINLLSGVVFFTVSHFFGAPAGLSILVGMTLGLGLPHFMTGIMISKRCNKFIELFPEAIDLIVRGLRSGLPGSETMRTVADELADPVGIEFRRVADSIKLGEPMEDALWSTAKRLDISEFKFFVISLSVQRETGGNLAETLENLSDILRRRRQMKLKVRALSSEARASAYIIGALPFIMFGLIMLINTDYAMTLLVDPRGMMMLGGVLLLMAMGGAIMFKMVRFEI